jgi:hypothetical protein
LIHPFLHQTLDCGDYTKGIARIRCTKAGCRTEFFRPLGGSRA